MKLPRSAGTMASMEAAAAPGALRVRLPTWLAVGVLLVVLFAVGYDQGLLLRPLLGQAGAAANHLHELFHDGRHLIGFPCH